MKKHVAIFLILIVLLLQSCQTEKPNNQLVPKPDETEQETPNIDDEEEEVGITPIPKPVYEWKKVDILQPTIIMGGISGTVLDKNVQKSYTDIVDRQIDMLAEELVSRIDYIYGTNNINIIHNIKDTTDNTLFSSYNSMNIFSDTVTKNMLVYNYKDEYICSDGTIMLDIEGEKVPYDSAKHNYYVIDNGIKYAAVTSYNVGGLFMSPTALQYTMQEIGRPAFDMSYPDGYHLDSILTLSNSIYGTPTWEYEEKLNVLLYYIPSYNQENTTSPWNWANDFANGTVKDKVKYYLAYIIANSITDYQDLPSESVILASDYDNLLSNILVVDNYVSTYQNMLFDILTKRMIGIAYSGDTKAGIVASNLAQSIYQTSLKVGPDSATYYNDGKYKSLYNSFIGEFHVQKINSSTSTNYTINDFTKSRNYKAYDVILKGILRQIAQVSVYKTCLPISYTTKSLSQSPVLSPYLDMTDVYLFFKQSINLDSYKIFLGVPYDSEIKLTDKNGNIINHTKEEDEQGQLVLNIKTTVNGTSSIPINLKNIQGYGATNTIEELLDSYDYIKISINSSSFKLDFFELVEVEKA